MLKTSQISFSYSPDRRFQFPEIAVEKGGHLLVLGKSGVGKTTLLHLLAGFLSPDDGAITLNDTPFHEMTGYDRDQFRARNVGMIFQVPHFVSSLNVTQNILWAQKLAKQKPNSKKVQGLLARLDLKHRAKANISRLSQGELQRASIIRGVINDPAVVLADEPTSSLDDENCERVIRLLEELTQSVGASLIVVTHDQRLKDFFTNAIHL